MTVLNVKYFSLFVIDYNGIIIRPSDDESESEY